MCFFFLPLSKQREICISPSLRVKQEAAKKKKIFAAVQKGCFLWADMVESCGQVGLENHKSGKKIKYKYKLYLNTNFI